MVAWGRTKKVPFSAKRTEAGTRCHRLAASPCEYKSYTVHALEGHSSSSTAASKASTRLREPVHPSDINSNRRVPTASFKPAHAGSPDLLAEGKAAEKCQVPSPLATLKRTRAASPPLCVYRSVHIVRCQER